MSLTSILADHADILESLAGNEERIVSRDDDLRIALAESVQDCGQVTGLWRMLIEFRLLTGENERGPGRIVGPSEFLQQCKQI